jgi:hypothetical protein
MDIVTSLSIKRISINLKKIAIKDIYSSQIPEKSTAKWHRILCLDKFSRKFNKKLPRDKIKVAYYNRRNLRNLLSNVKDSPIMTRVVFTNSDVNAMLCMWARLAESLSKEFKNMKPV